MARKLKGKQTGKGLKSMLSQHQATEKLNKSKAAKLEHQKQLKEQQKRKQTGQTKKAKLDAKAKAAVAAADSENGSVSTELIPLVAKVENRYIPFDANSTLMLVGEGDFSFAKSLILNDLILPENLIVTSYDSGINELELKYPHTFKENYDFLVEAKVTIVFKIDVTKLIKTFKLSKRNPWTKIAPGFANKKLDNIMFNFPHNGKGIKDQDRNIAEHQQLMSLFFQNCLEFFKQVNSRKDNKCFAGYKFDTNQQFYSPEGKVIVSMFEGEPYESWQIKFLGKTNGGWKVSRSSKFQWENYPEYHHKRTNSEMDTTKPAAERAARVYVFEINKKINNGKNSKNSKKEDDSDDE